MKTELGRGAVIDLLSGAQGPEVDVPPPAGIERVGQWKSFRARWHRYRVEGWRHDLAVKLGDDWSPDDARFVFEEMTRIAEMLADAGIGAVGLRPIGWLADPPAVGMPFVEGRRLSEVIRDALVSGDPKEANRVLRGAQAFGAALGCYHRLEPADDDGAVKQVETDFNAASRRVLVPRRTGWDRARRLQRARAYRLSPNDLWVTTDRLFVLLDPPHIRKYELVHRDVSAYLVEVDAICSNGWRPRRTVALQHRLRAAFLDGYAEAGPVPLDMAADGWALRLYESSRIAGMAYGHFRRRQLVKGARSALRAFRRRSSLGMSGMRQP